MDVDTANVHTYAQGSMVLVERDLQSLFDASTATRALAICEEHGLQRAFAARRELVNLKKVILHSFIDLLEEEKVLRRLCCYFFADHHFDESREASVSALATAECEEEVAFTHSPRYDAVATALADCRAARMALNDARDFCKGLCSVPRHPDVAWAAKLEALPATNGMSVSKLVVERESSQGGGTDDSADSPARRCASNEEAPSVSSHAMSAVLQSATGAGLSSAQVEVLRCVLIARGGAKCLGMRVGARRYTEAVHQMAMRLRCAAEAAATTEGGMAESGTTLSARCTPSSTASACDCNAATEATTATAATAATASVVSATLRPLLRRRRRHLECASAAGVYAELARWLARLVGDGRAEDSVRLFDASDRDSDRGPAQARRVTSFTPHGFELGAPLRRARSCVREFLPQMHQQMSQDAWPPPPDSLRGCVNGKQPCASCSRHFSPLWAHRGICVRCEEATRARGMCPYRKGCHGRGLFCHHLQRCLACEDYSCLEPGCMIVRGDGDAVTLLTARHVSSLRLLCLDLYRPRRRSNRLHLPYPPSGVAPLYFKPASLLRAFAAVHILLGLPPPSFILAQDCTTPCPHAPRNSLF